MASPYGIQHLKTPSRSFSSMSHTAGKTRFLNPAQEAWRSQWPIFKRFASVYRLEEVANYETDNPKAQAKYLEVRIKVTRVVHTSIQCEHSSNKRSQFLENLLVWQCTQTGILC